LPATYTMGFPVGTRQSMPKARQRDRPIRRAAVQLPSKIAGFEWSFSDSAALRSTESSRLMERAMGIEPTSEAWEASILPLNYARPSPLSYTKPSPYAIFSTVSQIIFGHNSWFLVSRPLFISPFRSDFRTERNRFKSRREKLLGSPAIRSCACSRQNAIRTTFFRVRSRARNKESLRNTRIEPAGPGARTQR
jgi:hypothetical protein